MRRAALTLALASAALFATAPASAAGPNVVTVHPGDMNGWGFLLEGSGGVGSLVTGPDGPPAGIGSVRLEVASGSEAIIVGTPYPKTRLDAVSAMRYSTFRTSGGPALAIALQLNVDYDLNDANVAWQGRLVFEPYHTQTVLTGAWQTWDTLAAGAGGNWWATGAPGNTRCPQSDPCTWSEVLLHFPDAGIRETLGAVLFKAGSGWAAFDGSADRLTIGVSGNETTYDFEPYLIASVKDDCKKGGWQSLYRADGSTFKNQGDCIQYVNTGK